MFDMSKIYTITFTDGTILRDLSVNGDNFISKTLIDPYIFRPENCRNMVINDGDKDEVHEFMDALITGEMDGSEYWFALFDSVYSEPVPPDMTIPQLQADVEYIAMMTGVEL